MLIVALALLPLALVLTFAIGLCVARRGDAAAQAAFELDDEPRIVRRAA